MCILMNALVIILLQCIILRYLLLNVRFIYSRLICIYEIVTLNMIKNLKNTLIFLAASLLTNLSLY